MITTLNDYEKILAKSQSFPNNTKDGNSIKEKFAAFPSPKKS